MHSSGKTLVLTLLGLCALSTLAARPAAAQQDQTLRYTLSEVTFADGATASGYFDYNAFDYPPAFSAFDITTTDGVTDTLTGTVYQFGSSTGQFDPPTTFIFFTSGPQSAYLSLTLENSTNPLMPNVDLIEPGQAFATGFAGSGEFTAGTGTLRVISGGSVDIGPVPAAVPEASTTVSLGLLLALGLGGFAVTARKKKTAV